MDFQQVKYTRFISPTTCYSGLRRLSEDGEATLTTESHSLRFTTSAQQQEQHETSGYTLPKPASDEIPCVGHDWCDDQQVFVLLQKNAVVDDSKAWNHMNSSDFTMDLQSTGAVAPHRRRPSISEASVASEATTTNASMNASTTGPMMAVEDEDTRHTSHIVWHNGGTSCGSAALHCRLLSPTFSKIDDDNNYLVWTGCAGDSELRCFQLIDKTRIRSISLESLEAFTSPIMSIEAICEKVGSKKDESQATTLAIGCQDGTVRLLTLSCRIVEDQKIELYDIHSHTVIVDGPILSLHLTTQRVLVGSMCGYVCQLQRDKSSISARDDVTNVHPHWQEPCMIFKDFLWDARYEADDPVLAVHFWRDRVLLGTYSGLVQVYCLISSGVDGQEDIPKSSKANYAMEWSVRLPYPVHAIAHFENQLVVTTSRSLHVFEAKSRSLYSADRAKERLKNLL